MSTREEFLPIGEFARRAGMTPRQLRYYQRLGILAPAAVDPASGYRYYDARQAETAEVITLLRSVDMPLADIQQVLAGTDDQRLLALFARHRARIQARLEKAATLLAAIDHVAQGGQEVQMKTTDAMQRCSFCGADAANDRIVVAGSDAAICDACVDAAQEVVLRTRREGSPVGLPDGSPSGGAELWDLFTQPTLDVLAGAQRFAADWDQPWVGTEHLLLGLLSEPQGAAGRLLREAGFDQDTVAAGIREVLARPVPAPPEVVPPTEEVIPTSRLRVVIDRAISAAGTEQPVTVGTGELLLGTSWKARALPQ